MFDLIAQTVPVTLGGLSLIALASDPVAPCGPSSEQTAQSITDHLRAMANHARSITVLIVRKSGATGD
ncbi:hypothetical protein P8A21_29105 [Streptomyces poriferorum]|uniref:hypothetical protein n=1 Tax=Streptomyces poriferorum TaxID=2798799 RepID=UPI00273EA16C|nr:hypothetical protein [Streptomyces sp. Alt1]WLQ51291.1 hypothetical protein P8A21_29105 [Streptomyces sp. Alt1]